ncbi:glycosyltransferase [Myroides marinus]|uniref:glycosyltransferase n=1 Tax=Myroides marinus TaxID=703342 RepID=UPI00257853AB|nr:glycosyltransferase [Myroides marinus]
MKSLVVIMSLYKNDRVQFLKESVESILNQSYSDFDFYIQCDGLVKEECQEYLASIIDSRVKVRYREDNKGLAYSLNELLEVVLPLSYEFIARMDADDISLPERFEKQLKRFREDEQLDCLGTWAIEINEQGEEYFRKQMPGTHEDCNGLFKKRDCLIHPTVMFKRRYFLKAGLYPLDTYFGEDTIMWMQGFQKGCRFGNVEEYLFKFRLDSNFFERRRGWKHAMSILDLRSRVNHTLNYGFKANVYMYLYAIAKLMPTKILNSIYKLFR